MTKRLGFEYLQGKISDVGMISGLYYEDYNGQIPMYIQNLVMRLQETLYRVIETHDMHRFRKESATHSFEKRTAVEQRLGFHRILLWAGLGLDRGLAGGGPGPNLKLGLDSDRD
jgi:hypothetical protein